MTPQQIEAMKLALEALEYWDVHGKLHQPTEEAITAIKEALAQSEQEFVALHVYKPTLPRGHIGNVSDGDLPWVYDQDPSSGYSARMLVHTTPPQRTEQEPVAYPDGDVVGPCICGSWPGGKCLKCPRITTSPQRPRVVFPTMLRKMWSGSEVQAWLDENVNKENT